MKIKLKSGQRLVCTHYKDHPIVVVDSHFIENDEVWVHEEAAKNGVTYGWWGPRKWFKVIPVKRAKKAVKHSGFLCEDNVAGCTCNQAASVGS